MVKSGCSGAGFALTCQKFVGILPVGVRTGKGKQPREERKVMGLRDRRDEHEVNRTKVIPWLVCRLQLFQYPSVEIRRVYICDPVRRDKHETSAGCFINANILLPIRCDHSRVRTFPLVNRSNLFFRLDNSERNMTVGYRRVSVNTVLQLIIQIQLDDRVNYRTVDAIHRNDLQKTR